MVSPASAALQSGLKSARLTSGSTHKVRDRIDAVSSELQSMLNSLQEHHVIKIITHKARLQT